MSLLPFTFQRLRPIMFCMYDLWLSNKMYKDTDASLHYPALYIRRMIPILRKLELV